MNLNVPALVYFVVCLLVIVVYNKRQWITQLVYELVLMNLSSVLFVLVFGTFPTEKSDLEWLQIRSHLLPRIRSAGTRVTKAYNTQQIHDVEIKNRLYEYRQAMRLRAQDRRRVAFAEWWFYFCLDIARNMGYESGIPKDYGDFKTAYAD